MSVERIEKIFSCPDSPHLTLSNIRGSVKIQPGDNGVIAVAATKQKDSGDEENSRIEMSQSNNGSVNIHTRYDHMGFRFFGKRYPCKVDYEVFVPKECSLKIRGVNNSATIEGISGELDISTVSGDIECRSLMGQLKIKTVSGDVRGEAISGSGQLNSVSGDINLKNSDFSALRGKTVSADLVIETPLENGPYDFNSVSGDIKLDVSPMQGAIISSSSLSGDIRTSLPYAHANKSGKNRRIKINGGGVEINHSSVSGDLFVDSRNNNGTKENKLAEIPDGDRSLKHNNILERVESGELSVDQALQMIAGNSVP
jgi:DUF4097 and DUF4098 domain-containing protein YvlB